jgi:hypothetical protein
MVRLVTSANNSNTVDGKTNTNNSQKAVENQNDSVHDPTGIDNT